MTHKELQEIEKGIVGRKKMNGVLIEMGISKGKATGLCSAYKWLQEHSAKEFETIYDECGNAETMKLLGINKDTMYGLVELLGGKYQKRPDIEEEWLYKEYIEKNRSMADIAEEIGANKDYVGRQLKKYRITKDKRNRYEASAKKGKETSVETGAYKRACKKRETTMKQRYGVDNAMACPEIKKKTYGENADVEIIGDVERLKYLIESLTAAERTYENIGQIIGVGRETVRRAISVFGLCNMIPNDRHDSTPEHELTEWIKSIIPDEDVQENVRVIGKEIDVYLPSRNIGIELNGVYWHSTRINKDKYNVAHKQKEAEEKGIFIIEVWDVEWTDPQKREIVKDYIKAKLGKTEKRIAARKCTVTEIGKREKREFLAKYHILGNSRDMYAYGLRTKDGELVAVATFGRNYRTAADVDMHLNRWCTKADTIVQGGFSKVFKYATSKHPEWNTIVTHTDLRWSRREENVHMKNGFVCAGFLPPSPMVYRNGKLLNSLALKKSRIKKIYPNADITKPTQELITELGIIIVYDAGKTRNIWRREPK